MHTHAFNDDMSVVLNPQNNFSTPTNIADHTHALAIMRREAMTITSPVSFCSLPTMNKPIWNSAHAAYAPARILRNPISQSGRFSLAGFSCLE